MIRDALNPPGKTPHDKFKNYDGSNRYKIMTLFKILFILNTCKLEIYI